MMPMSGITWTKEDYMRFPKWLLDTGEEKEAEKAIACIDKLFENFNSQIDEIQMQNAQILDTDLVEADCFLGCCSECAKYRGRIFSISGNDKRFPKKPTQYSCTCQGIMFHPFIYGIDEPIYCPEGVDIIEYSNRPFIDDRSDKEKEVHQHYCKTQGKKIK